MAEGPIFDGLYIVMVNKKTRCVIKIMPKNAKKKKNATKICIDDQIYFVQAKPGSRGSFYLIGITGGKPGLKMLSSPFYEREILSFTARYDVRYVRNVILSFTSENVPEPTKIFISQAAYYLISICSEKVEIMKIRKENYFDSLQFSDKNKYIIFGII